MAENFYGKGITVASGFDLGAKSPLDSRNIVNTINERNEHVTNNRAYEGMIVYVIEDKTTYQLVGDVWQVFGYNPENAEESTNLIIDGLNSTLTNASLSANQGRILHELIVILENSVYTIEQIDEIKKILDDKDLETMEMLLRVESAIPNKVSKLENDLNFVTKEYVDEIAKTIPDEVEIPTKLSEFENDTNFVNKEYVDDRISEIISTGGGNNGESSGGAGVYVGENPPLNTNLIWIDSSTVYTLNPNTYEERLRLNYISMLNKSYFRLLALNSSLTNLEKKINEISSNHNTEIIEYKTQLSKIKSQISVLENNITSTISLLNDLGNDLESLKNTSKNIRKNIKSQFLLSLDLKNQILTTLDNEKGITIPDDGGNGDDNDDNIISNENALLTELGLNILTEDGLMIIADVLSVPQNALLTETGISILTEDGKIILIDGIASDETDEVIKNAILMENGKAILTENGRILLKG